MKKVLLSVLTIISFQLYAQDNISGLAAFDAIDIRGNAIVNLSQGSPQEVKVSGGDSKNIQVNGNSLMIDGKSATYYITMPEVRSLSIAGKGTINSVSPVTSDNLQLDIRGSGDMNLELMVKNLSADIRGVGKLKLKGSGDNATFTIPGSGKVDALDFTVKNCNANIAGIGKIAVDVTESLNSNIAGNGTVNYKNAPPVINETISGSGSVGSQSAAGEPDTTRFNLGETEVIVVGSKKDKDSEPKTTKPFWSGIELGINTYVDGGNSFDLNPGNDLFELKTEKSVLFALNFAQKNFEIGKSNIWITTGLGLSWNNYRFENNVSLINGDVTSAMRDSVSDIHYKKSKLVVTHLNVPLMLTAFTSRNPKDAFHISVGVIGGLRIGSHTKQKFESEGETSKPKVFDDFNLNPFHYGFRAAVGYNKLNVFAEYYASSLFKSKKGPELYPVNFGFTLVGF